MAKRKLAYHEGLRIVELVECVEGVDGWYYVGYTGAPEQFVAAGLLPQSFFSGNARKRFLRAERFEKTLGIAPPTGVSSVEGIFYKCGVAMVRFWVSGSVSTPFYLPPGERWPDGTDSRFTSDRRDRMRAPDTPQTMADRFDCYAILTCRDIERANILDTDAARIKTMIADLCNAIRTARTKPKLVLVKG